MKIFEYFNLDNINSWIKSLIMLMILPKKFIEDIEKRRNTELLSQYFFYFIVYTAFFIFVNSEYSNENLVKQSIFTLINNSFSLFSVFIVTIIVTDFRKVKIVIIYVLGLILLLTPSILIFKSLFWYTENYNYELFSNVICAILFIYANYVIAFIICKDWKRKVQFLVLNYLILNGVLLLYPVINIDNNSPDFQNDPIYKEYSEMYTKFQFIDKYPAVQLYTFYKDSVYFRFFLTKGDTSMTTTNDKDEILYKTALQENIKQIEHTNYLFKRNADIGLEYKRYFQQIQALIKQEYFYPEDLKKYGYSSKISGLPRDTIIHNYKVLKNDNLLLKRQELVNYHDALIQSKKKSLLPIAFINITQFFISDLIMNKIINKQTVKVVKITNFRELE